MRKPTGYVVYDGPSKINGERIIAIATGFSRASRNPKTGKMLQVWILTLNNPVKAFINGKDYSVCGNCKHRKWKTCYVRRNFAPYQIWSGFKRGIYPTLPSNKLFAGWDIRIGAVGDPSAVPTKVWRSIIKYAKGSTGYTHSFNARWIDPKLKQFCMASCDTLTEAIEAKAKGWRPFYVRGIDEKLTKDFFPCPAAKESGGKSNCSKCGSCKGGEYDNKKCPSIQFHGTRWRKIRFAVMRKRYNNKERYAFTPIVRDGIAINA